MAAIELRDVRKSFQAMEVIHGVDLRVDDGTFTVFVGPSGCGKSTLLRMIAGLEEVSSGEIRIDGARCDHLLPSARGMAMVFQSYALYPHMNVEQNLRFGLENLKMPRAEIDKRVGRAAEILQISHLMKRRPSQLSGGQSQRVAIGRAIVKEPKAFLFDEPLSNLDAELRVKMRAELVALHRRLGSTMIYVTHDQVEAMTMADQIVVLRDGKVEQVGSPIELYARPANQFVAGFLGAPQMNFLRGSMCRRNGSLGLALNDGVTIALPGRDAELADGAPLTVGIRPEHAEIGDGELKARVEATEILGSETIIHARLQSGEGFTLARRGISAATAGDEVMLALPAAFVHLFDEKGVTVGATADWRRDYVR
ncbi:sn-glycerol-3-phosphate ABC transporter ATP-binding protein UgpC [Mesorhizobium sp. BAC0120]|uniref:ABC transporter ATP-binding protein n=1 Tax=Mesorhizobium sp. BAC0120 TaxID=3090670 RepID=UPI00298C3956|nr:sn-glycerol-3-phosphate ABC transporter ATP-binding protein UgpC [Mesorhizobium sp. BAC0120]MDW6025795.1 sn-glycerol-3-phosphate ABC transporter ATP-binding protein UgpC [Mesorhizobium sp. BAC0120]